MTRLDDETLAGAFANDKIKADMVRVNVARIRSAAIGPGVAAYPGPGLITPATCRAGVDDPVAQAGRLVAGARGLKIEPGAEG